tara:strand:- start:1516 stop:3411 length:1896 start_codon:yes stop_codon:yes gene_type:complete
MNTKVTDIEEIENNINCHDNFKIYKEILNELLMWVTKYDKNNLENIRDDFAKTFNKIYRSTYIKNRSKNLIIKKNVIINVFKKYYDSDNAEPNIQLLANLLQKKPSRNISGITSITVITHPYPNGQSFSCKHNCYYCPNEPAHEGNNFQAQPRSYLYDEPAVRRANQHGFDSYGQMVNRMDTLFMNGQKVDKIDIVVEGGTYTEYPIDYLQEYHRDLFYAANTYFDEFKRERLSIEEEIRINETAKAHIIGISIETRPDALDNDWLKRFRKWGVTRIQLGVQHTDNKILKKINRGHNIECAIDAMKYLKDNCFKIHIHIMPDLPDSNPDMDKKMFDFVYEHICPDEMKIYPCQVVPWTIIERWNKQGKYTPYSDSNIQALIDVIKYAMINCPCYVRFPRVVRDIPATYISAGNTVSNLRQVIDNDLANNNLSSKDIRTREIGRHVKYYNKKANYNIYKFHQNGGIEYFICYESYDKVALFGFIRLRFPSKNCDQVFNVLKNRALIRELHVYGSTNSVGYKDNTTTAAQHIGIGSNLLKMAEWIAFKNLYPGIVVISGEGVKGYYRKRGYREEDTFMVKDFNGVRQIMEFHSFLHSILVDYQGWHYNPGQKILNYCFVIVLFCLMLVLLFGN